MDMLTKYMLTERKPEDEGVSELTLEERVQVRSYASFVFRLAKCLSKSMVGVVVACRSDRRTYLGMCYLFRIP